MSFTTFRRKLNTDIMIEILRGSVIISMVSTIQCWLNPEEGDFKAPPGQMLRNTEGLNEVTGCLFYNLMALIKLHIVTQYWDQRDAVGLSIQ